MGVQDFKKELSNVIRKVSNLKGYILGSVIALDMNYYIRRALTFIITILLASSWESLSIHMQNFISEFSQRGAFPYPVFDGQPLPGKKHAHDKRKKLQNEAIEKLQPILGLLCSLV